MKMNLWKTRDAAIAALASEMCEEDALMCEVFDVFDNSIRHLEEVGGDFAYVTALALVKARHLGLACYDLCLNGLAQESGALFRVLIETLECLTYFRLDPSRVQQAIDQKLPKAGTIAKTIGGRFKDVRDHLNENASHLGWSSHSLRHLFDPATGGFRLQQQFSPSVLRRNMRTLFTILVYTAIEGVNCLGIADGRDFDGLADRIERLKSEGVDSFTRLVKQPSVGTQETS